MKQTIQKLLADVSRKIIVKYNPKIIGITGSVGKTSTRDAIFDVVSTGYATRKPHRNYNNEFGLPFAILGVDSPGRSIFGWLRLFAKAYSTLWFGPFPKVLILEMGIDRPGDMDYLLQIAKPNIAVVTTIGASHYEFFKNLETVEAEKGKLIEALTPDGTAIVNADNEASLRQSAKTKARVLSYGESAEATVNAAVIEEKFFAPGLTKLRFTTPVGSFETSINAIGAPHVSAVAAAVAVGFALDMHQDLIVKGLQAYKPVPGRLNLIDGLKGSLLIDDTYNAAPDSMKRALGVLARSGERKKMAILGDMLELGELTEGAHLEIGTLVGNMNLMKLVTVGPAARKIAEAAHTVGMPLEQIISLETADQALDFMRNALLSGSAILIKGSQGMRLEKVTKELMAEPMRAPELLCRQYGKWLEN